MNTVAIIQARMGSTRLPMKMIKLLAGKPLIWHVINRVKQAALVNKVVLATSKKKNNAILIDKAEEYGISSFVGSEEDVLDRYYQCAKKYNADIIVRITGDCPLVDPKIIDEIIALFKENDVDYVSNVFPPTYPDGLDVEVLSFEALERIWKQARLRSEREHPTSYIWNNKKLFKCINLKNKEDLSGLRLTVDTKEDLILVNQLLNKLDSEDYSLKDIMNVIKENPQLVRINNKFSRNEGYVKSLKENKEVR